MNTADAQRLLEEQTAAIRLTDERTDQLKKFKADYEALHKRLKTLPDKLTHDVMVPFGKLAFMPGKLVHTNEVTVLLGDNWFVDRSAHQACGIIDRRIEVLDGQLEELNQQRGLLEPRKEFTEQLWDVGKEADGRFEIHEEYDEQKEIQWKAKHRQNVKNYRQQQREKAEKLVGSSQPAPLTDIELWAKLDELEEDERVGREMERLDEENDLPQATHSINSLSNRGEHAAHSAHLDGETDSEEEEEDSDDEEDENDADDFCAEDTTLPRPTFIRFSHTPTEVIQAGGSTSPKDVDASPPIITSPADVYKHFAPQGPRSILRSPGSSSSGSSRHVTITEPVHTKERTEPQQYTITAAKLQPTSVSAKAFTGSIVEHAETVQAETPGQGDAQSPRVSRFKAQRLRQQNR